MRVIDTSARIILVELKQIRRHMYEKSSNKWFKSSASSTISSRRGTREATDNRERNETTM